MKIISVMVLSFNILLKGSICCASVVNNTNQKFGNWFPELDSGMLEQLTGFLNSLNRFSVYFVCAGLVGAANQCSSPESASDGFFFFQ